MNERIEKYCDELNELTNSINFENFLSYPDYSENYISRLAQFTGSDYLPSFICNYKVEGIDFMRAVSYKKPDEDYNKINEFWYPEPHYITNIGRAYFIGQQVLYCCDQSATALFETRPSGVGSKIGLMTFRLKKDLKLMSFGMFEESDFYKDQTINFSDKEIAMNIFFANKFKEKVEFNHLYYPTAIITNYFFSGKIDGIIFPSVIANSKGDNIVLKPKIMDDFYLLKEFRILEVIEYNSELDFKVKCISVSNSSKKGIIDWDSVFCDGHQYDETIFH